MSLAKCEDVIAEANFDESTDEAKITPHLVSAELRLRRVITDAVYNATQAISRASSAKLSELDGDGRRRFELTKAEALLACFYGLPKWNIESTGNGIKTSGGIGDGQYTNLRPDEVDTVRQMFLDQANELILKYIPAGDETTDDTVSAGGLNMAAI